MRLSIAALFTALATGNAMGPLRHQPLHQDTAVHTADGPGQHLYIDNLDYNLDMIMDPATSQDLIAQLQEVVDCATPEELVALIGRKPNWANLLEIPTFVVGSHNGFAVESVDVGFVTRELPEIRLQAQHRIDALRALQDGSFSVVRPEGRPLTTQEMARMAPEGAARDGAAQMVQRLADYSADHASVGGTTGLVTGYVGAQALMTWVWTYLTPAVALGAAGGTTKVVAGVTIVALHGPALAAGTAFLAIWHGTTAVGAIPSATVAIGGWCEKRLQSWFPNMRDRLSTDGAQRTALLFVPMAHKTISGMFVGTALGNCLEGLCRRGVVRPMISLTGRNPDEYVAARPNPVFRKGVEGCIGGLRSFSSRCCGRQD